MNTTNKEKLDYILEVIGAEVDPQNPDELLKKLNNLINLSGHAAELVAVTEEQYKRDMLEAYKETIEEKPPSTVHSKVLESMVAGASATHTYADRINAALKLSVEGLRTMISLYKAETENATR